MISARGNWAAVVIGVGLAGTAFGAAEPSQALFERVFGDAVKLDPAMLAKVKAAKPGQRFWSTATATARTTRSGTWTTP